MFSARDPRDRTEATQFGKVVGAAAPQHTPGQSRTTFDDCSGSCPADFECYCCVDFEGPADFECYCSADFQCPADFEPSADLECSGSVYSVCSARFPATPTTVGLRPYTTVCQRQAFRPHPRRTR